MIPLIGLVLLSGCVKTTGAKIEDFGPARANIGPSVDIRLLKDARTASTFAASTYKVQAELLTADETGMIVLYALGNANGVRVTRIPYSLIRKCFFEDLQYLNFGESRKLTDSRKEQIRLVSRFPGGVESAAFQKILESMGQTEVDLIESRP